MARALFAPISIVSGFIAGLLAKKAFAALWGRVSNKEAPDPDQREVSWPLLAASLAIQGAVFQLTRGLVDHAARTGFLRFTGAWPGGEREPT